jgi:hypothetical protein
VLADHAREIPDMEIVVISDDEDQDNLAEYGGACFEIGAGLDRDLD